MSADKHRSFARRLALLLRAKESPVNPFLQRKRGSRKRKMNRDLLRLIKEGLIRRSRDQYSAHKSSTSFLLTHRPIVRRK